MSPKIKKFTEEMSNDLARIHADHQQSKIAMRIAEEIDKVKGEHAEIKERLANLEEDNEW